MRRGARLALAILTLGVCACGETAETPGAPEIDPAQAQMLDMLGYVDFGDRVDEHTGITIYDPDRSSAGFNLITYSVLARAELVDADGHLLRTWSAGDDRAASTDDDASRWMQARLLADGQLLVVVQPAGLIRLAPDGSIRWRTPPHEPHFHHFVDVLPDGRIVGLVSERRWRMGYSRFRVIDDSVAMLTAEGEMLEQRFLLDVAQRNPEWGLADEPTRTTKKKSTQGTIDLFHLNRIQWLTEDSVKGDHPLMRPGRVLLTVRNQDSLVLLDWETQEIVWMWGRGVLGFPHDAQVLPNGHVLVFDNIGPAEGSRVLEVDPLRDEIVWTYRAPVPADFFSATRGTVQRLPGGTTLIAESNQGRAFEVTPEGEIVWEYRTPHRDDAGRPAAFRIERYPAAALAPVLAEIDGTGREP